MDLYLNIKETVLESNILLSEKDKVIAPLICLPLENMG
jgi:hypothetical protein